MGWASKAVYIFVVIMLVFRLGSEWKDVAASWAAIYCRGASSTGCARKLLCQLLISHRRFMIALVPALICKYFTKSEDLHPVTLLMNVVGLMLILDMDDWVVPFIASSEHIGAAQRPLHVSQRTYVWVERVPLIFAIPVFAVLTVPLVITESITSEYVGGFMGVLGLTPMGIIIELLVSESRKGCWSKFCSGLRVLAIGLIPIGWISIGWYIQFNPTD